MTSILTGRSEAVQAPRAFFRPGRILGMIIERATTVAADRPRYDRYAPPFTPAWAAPYLVVTPDYGAPGMQVEISGAKFHRDIGVYYGGEPMEVLAVSDRVILAVIPWRARGSDFIYVVDNTGRARTAVPFGLERSNRYREW